MPDWIIWMGAIWLFFAVTGRGSCRSTRVSPSRDWATLPSDTRRTGPGRLPHGDLAHPTTDAHGPAARHRRRTRALPDTPRAETVEERLQRQFVEGRLSIDEYEEALWRELRPRRGDEPDRTKPPAS